MTTHRLWLKRIVGLFLLISLVGYCLLFLSNSILFADTFFHIGRIYEIRYAFQHFEFPNWLNFQSFFGIGQAVNGMYPDISLYPFVLLTMPLSPFHQVVAIQVLIAVLTIIVTYVCLTRRHVPTDISLYTSTIYTFALLCRQMDFKPGTSIILIFGLPMAFTTFDILVSKNFDIKLALKFALVVILVLYSHFLSIIVLAFMMASIFAYLLITKKTSIYAITNILVAMIISILAISPIIYRYLLINQSGITMPFSQGNIHSVSLPFLIKRAFFAFFVIIVSFLTYHKKSIRSAFTSPLTLLILYVCFLCTYFPWKLFNHVPLVNNFQFADTRFSPLLFIIAAIFISQTQGKSISRTYKILGVLAILMILLSTALLIHRTRRINILPFNADTYKAVTLVRGSYNKEEQHVNQDMFYDYYPYGVSSSLKLKNNVFLSKKGQRIVWNPTIKSGKNQIPIKKVAINNGVNITPKKSLTSTTGKITLPMLGYKSLNYQVRVNGKNVSYTINGLYLAVHQHHLSRSDVITVMFHNPTIYTWLMVIALIYVVLLISVLVYLT